MSSSGQAPNVSMDELLASIKSMIEGESQSGGTPQSEASSDDGIMDLTKVVAPPQAPVAPLQPEHHAGFDGQQAQLNDPSARNEEQGAVPTPQSKSVQELVPDGASNSLSGMPAGQNPNYGERGIASDNPPAQRESGSAEDTASQIKDLLGAMNDDLGIGAEASRAPTDFSGEAGKMAAESERPAGFADGHGHADGDDVQPLSQQGNVAPQGRPGLNHGQMPTPQPQGVPGQPPSHHMQGQSPMGPGVGQTPHAGGQPHPGQHPDHMPGQPPLQRGLNPHQQVPGHQALPHAQGGVAANADANAGRVGPDGRPINAGQPGQPNPGGGHTHLPNQGIKAPQDDMRARDPRLESELAMGQALSQADVSLGLGQNSFGQTPPGQRGVSEGGNPLERGFEAGAPFAGAEEQMRGMNEGHHAQIHSHMNPAQMPQVPQHMPQGQLPAVSNGDGLPVPAAGRSMVPAAQPMMAMADPSVDQLPVEMRNNLEEIVKQLLKPLLREWLERNLPDLIKGAVDENGKIDPNRM
jgi:cell pole-organizing protein PopZ